MEEGEIIEDEDNILMVYSHNARLFDEDHDVVSMEIGSDSDEAVDSRRLTGQHQEDTDEAEELRELLLSQVLKRKKRPEEGGQPELSRAASTLSSRSKRSTRKEGSPRTESSSSTSSLLPPPPPPPHADSLRRDSTTTRRSEEGSRSRDTHSHEYGKAEKELDSVARRIGEMGEEFTDASSKYETARKRKRDYLESIAQCDATLAKYQRVMEGLWVEMVSLSSGAASSSLKGMKKMKSAHSKLQKTLKEQKTRIGEKEDEIEQLRAKNQLLESIIRKEEAAVEEKRRKKAEASRRKEPPAPDRSHTAREPASAAAAASASRIDNCPASTVRTKPQQTSHSRAGRQSTNRYFHLEHEHGDTAAATNGCSSSKSTATSKPETAKQPSKPSDSSSRATRSSTTISTDESRLRPPPATTTETTTTPRRTRIPLNPPIAAAHRITPPPKRLNSTESALAAPPVNGHTVPARNIAREFDTNPLMKFRAYRLSKNFPFHLIMHPAVTNRLDPNLPLCPFMLNGRCADTKCPWQHESDYRLSDEEIIKELMLACPGLCPSGVPQARFPNSTQHTPELVDTDTFVSEQLKKHSVEEVARRLVSRFPDEHAFSDLLANDTPTDSRPRRPVPECADEPIEYERQEQGWWERLGDW